MAKLVFKPGEVTAHKLSNGHVALVMTPNTAQCLADVMALIGGIPWKSRRRYTALISDALHKVGVSWKRGSYSDEHRRDVRPATEGEQGFYFLDRDDLGEDGLSDDFICLMKSGQKDKA